MPSSSISTDVAGDEIHDEIYDVIVVGGGPAGAATAIALAQRGITAAIVERNAVPPPRVGETLPPAVREPLGALGVWQRFIDDGHDPAVGNRSSWGSDRVDEVHFIRNAYGHGWHIDRQKFETMLLDAARARGVPVLAGAPIDAWERADGHVVTIGGQRVRARFAVDASGRASFLARISGAERVAIDQLVASTMFLAPRADDPQQKFTLIEAVHDGWWYSAPLPDGRLVAAFMTDGTSLRTREEWIAAARRTRVSFDRVAAYVPGDAAPQVAAANTSRLTSVVGPDWLAAGDAAVSFDPLSSQGIMVALESALDAANAIADGAAAAADGRDAALSRYASIVTDRYRRYLVERARYYSAERRWPDAPFWRRRHLHRDLQEEAHADAS